MKTIKKKDTLLIEGMTCSNCASGIQKHLKSNGLEDVTVNFSTQKLTFSLIKSVKMKLKK